MRPSIVFLYSISRIKCELVQCRRAAQGCLPPLPPSHPRRQISHNPSNMDNIFGPIKSRVLRPCPNGACFRCNLPLPCQNACKYKDKFIPIGKTFLPRTEDPCRVGICTEQNGRKEIKYHHDTCSICSKECIQQPQPGKCCPTCECGPVFPDACPPFNKCPVLSCPLKDRFTQYQECCPECRYCIDQWGKAAHNDKTTWWYYEEKCTCNKGRIDCITPGSEPNPYIGKSCVDGEGKTRLHGDEWPDLHDKCKICDCNNGKIVCSTRCPSKHCKSGQILGRTRRDCCPICINNPNTCLAYGRGHLMTVDGNVTNIENCIYTLMSNCQNHTPGISGKTEYPPPAYNGNYIPHISSHYYEDSISKVDPDYYENYPDYAQKRSTKNSQTQRLCRDQQTGKSVECGDSGWGKGSIGASSDTLGDHPWSIDLVTDFRGKTAGVVIKMGYKTEVEVLRWDDLRINGVKIDLPFQNSQMVAEIFCGIIQITTNIGFALTMDKNGQVECSAPDNTKENTPVYVPESWIENGRDRNDGFCEVPGDCLDNSHCRHHPKCDPKCKGDGCNHPDCRIDQRCPDGSEFEDTFYKHQSKSTDEKPRILCNPLDPSNKACDWVPFGNPNSQLCGACSYPQRVNPQCIVPPNSCQHPRARTHAHAECAIIKGPGFAACHTVIHPDPFYAACIQDRCRNFGRKPVCEILQAYDLECNRANVQGMYWREKSYCNMRCTPPFIWSDCGKPCDETCDDPAPACFGKCVPGCRCPAGLIKHKDYCIRKELCPSYEKPPDRKYNPYKCSG